MVDGGFYGFHFQIQLLVLNQHRKLVCSNDRCENGISAFLARITQFSAQCLYYG